MHNSVVGSAAAQVTTHALAQFISIQLDNVRFHVTSDMARHSALCFRHHSNRRADLTRCAVAALKSVMLDEGLLQRVRMPILRQPLDRGNLSPLVLHRKRQARQDAFAIGEHRAGATSSQETLLSFLAMNPSRLETTCKVTLAAVAPSSSRIVPPDPSRTVIGNRRLGNTAFRRENYKESIPVPRL